MVFNEILLLFSYKLYFEYINGFNTFKYLKTSKLYKFDSCHVLFQKLLKIFYQIFVQNKPKKHSKEIENI